MSENANMPKTSILFFINTRIIQIGTYSLYHRAQLKTYSSILETVMTALHPMFTMSVITSPHHF